MYAYTCKCNSQLMGTRDYTKFCIYYTNIMIKKFKQYNVVIILNVSLNYRQYFVTRKNKRLVLIFVISVTVRSIVPYVFSIVFRVYICNVISKFIH